jgi:hypothetical protein
MDEIWIESRMENWISFGCSCVDRFSGKIEEIVSYYSHSTSHQNLV